MPRWAICLSFQTSHEIDIVHALMLAVLLLLFLGCHRGGVRAIVHLSQSPDFTIFDEVELSFGVTIT
jgi:hypothetical protein